MIQLSPIGWVLKLIVAIISASRSDTCKLKNKGLVLRVLTNRDIKSCFLPIHNTPTSLNIITKLDNNRIITGYMATYNFTHGTETSAFAWLTSLDSCITKRLDALQGDTKNYFYFYPARDRFASFAPLTRDGIFGTELNINGTEIGRGLITPFFPDLTMIPIITFSSSLKRRS